MNDDTRDLVLKYIETHSPAIARLFHEKISSSLGPNTYEDRLGPITNTYAIVHARSMDFVSYEVLRQSFADSEIVVLALYVALTAIGKAHDIIAMDCNMETMRKIRLDDDKMRHALWLCCDTFDDADTFKKILRKTSVNFMKELLSFIDKPEYKTIILKQIDEHDSKTGEVISL